MPSSPKLLHAWLRCSRKSALLVFACLIIGVVGFIFGVSAILAVSHSSYRCDNSLSIFVKALWTTNANNKIVNSGLESESKRHKVMGFVGIQTGFGSVGQRTSLRKTWMPSNRQGLQRLEEATGLAFRFVIGRTSDSSKMSALRKEVAEYDDFLLLDIQEEYSNLPYKTLAFFRAAYALFDSEFYVKADDDIYLRPDRLSLLLAKERTHPQTYLGCMKKGPVFTDPKLKWYEPWSHLIGKEYFLHAYGAIYALSSDVVASLVALRNDSFRIFSNEDVMIGSWMLAMNVNHEDNKGLCQAVCTSTFIAVWDIPKCSETKLLELHQLDSCSKSPTLAADVE